MSISNAVYSVQAHRGLWRVSLDGKYFGDYRSKEHALASVATAMRCLEATGRFASIVVTP